MILATCLDLELSNNVTAVVIIHSIWAAHSFMYSMNISVLDALVEHIGVKTLFEKE